MKTVMNTENVKVTVRKTELLEGKYLPFITLSNKIGEIEKNNSLGYKQLRNRMYNSKAGNKYNLKEIAGFKCIDIENPMKGTASLCLEFEVVEC